MIPSSPPVSVPESYETLDLKDIKVSHHPVGAPSATPVVVVTLNRPEKHNAYTIHMMHAFEKIYPMFDVDERVKVIVLTGAGRTFCAGADLEIGFDSVSNTRERVMDHRDSYGHHQSRPNEQLTS
jgi:enoyl-CoA hydratase/carnithine racemase